MSPCPLLLGVLVACASNTGGAADAVPEPVPGPEDRWIAEDKAQHFALSFAATGMTYGAGRLALDPPGARLAAAGLTLVLGLGKEVVDSRTGGTFSFKDLTWDIAGIAVGYTFARRMD